MYKRLHNNGVDFLPSVHGSRLLNYSLMLDNRELKTIKKEAFTFNIIPDGIIDIILQKTLASGVCSGISAYTLAKFNDINSCIENDQFIITVYQARAWGRPFIQECIKSYFYSVDNIITAIESSLEKEKDLLLVILPKLFYFKNISRAHTIIPYAISKGLMNISIRVFDSNYPGDDSRALIINKASKAWTYDGRSTEKWALTVNKSGNLTQKVPFLL